MKVYTTIEEIKKKFIRDGWDKSISFHELTIEEAKKDGLSFAIYNINEKTKFFVMDITGDVYNNRAQIVFYNVLS